MRGKKPHFVDRVGVVCVPLDRQRVSGALHVDEIPLFEAPSIGVRIHRWERGRLFELGHARSGVCDSGGRLRRHDQGLNERAAAG